MRALARNLLVALAVAGSVGTAWADAPHGRARAKLVGVANLNDAPEDVLELLPGIGEVRADEILEYRKKHPFKRVEELRKIKGIGRKTLAKLRPFLTLTGKSTLADENKDAENDGDKEMNEALKAFTE